MPPHTAEAARGRAPESCDTYSRSLSWRLSNMLTTDCCLDAVQEAMHDYGALDIFNTDYGCLFTSQQFMGLLTQHHIASSMDGTG